VPYDTTSDSIHANPPTLISEETQLSQYRRHNHDSIQFKTWLLCLQRYAIGQAGGDRAVPAGGHSRTF
jgi:hypothetical protein